MYRFLLIFIIKLGISMLNKISLKSNLFRIFILDGGPSFDRTYMNIGLTVLSSVRDFVPLRVTGAARGACIGLYVSGEPFTFVS